jgi:hypothetical protein
MNLHVHHAMGSHPYIPPGSRDLIVHVCVSSSIEQLCVPYMMWVCVSASRVSFGGFLLDNVQ